MIPTLNYDAILSDPLLLLAGVFLIVGSVGVSGLIGQSGVVGTKTKAKKPNTPI